MIASKRCAQHGIAEAFEALPDPLLEGLGRDGIAIATEKFLSVRPLREAPYLRQRDTQPASKLTVMAATAGSSFRRCVVESGQQ